MAYRLGIASRKEVDSRFKISFLKIINYNNTIFIRTGQLFAKCYMQSLLHGLHACHISPDKVKRIEQVQSRNLNKILELPESTPTRALFLETGL